MTKTGTKKNNDSIYFMVTDAIGQLQLSVLILAMETISMILTLSLLCPDQML